MPIAELQIAQETHVVDTLVVVAALHMHAFVLLFALIRTMRGGPRNRWAWPALALAVVGGHLFAWGSSIAGSRGMPRRFAQYLEVFASLQRVTSIGAIVMFVGLALCLVALGAAPRALGADEG